MTMKYGLFTSEATFNEQGLPEYDRAVDEVFVANYMKGFFTDGIFPYPTDNFQVVAVDNPTGLQVNVKPGKALMCGRFAYDDEDYTITLDDAESELNRIDRIVLRLDFVDRKITVEVKKGTPASTAIPPELTRTSNTHEIALADVSVLFTTTVIYNAAITDRRADSELCGYVTPMTDVIDADDFFIQINDLFYTFFEKAQDDFDTQTSTNQTTFDEQKTTNQADWDYWFDNVKDKLSEDAAGHLQNQIDTINTTTTTIQSTIDNMYHISTATLSTTWTGADVPYTQTIDNADVKADSVIEISLANTATAAQVEEWNALNLQDGGQTESSFTLRCFGDKNTIAIPIVVVVTEV